MGEDGRGGGRWELGVGSWGRQRRWIPDQVGDDKLWGDDKRGRKGMDYRFHGNDKGETARSWELGDGEDREDGSPIKSGMTNCGGMTRGGGKAWIPVFTGMTGCEGMTE